MSLIVAVKDKDRFVIGCDTRMSSSVCYEDGYNERPKAIKLKNRNDSRLCWECWFARYIC